jgi:predicted phosphodiesterase
VTELVFKPRCHIGDVLFCHATPRDDNEILPHLTPENRLKPIFEAPGADLVFSGHTHMRFDRKIGTVRVVNADSVRMPFWNPGAYWLLLESSVEQRCTKYDLSAATERIRATDLKAA